MKSKKAKIICVVVLCLILIGVVVLIAMQKKDNGGQGENVTPGSNVGSETTPNESNSGEIVPTEYISLDKGNYHCEKKQTGYENVYTSYAGESVIVENGRVMNSQPYTKIQYLNAEDYNEAKSFDEYGETAEYDDANLMVIYSASPSVDFTKNSNGEDLNYSFEEYNASLKEAGYECSNNE